MWHHIVRNVDANRQVFTDDSGANITLACRYSRAPVDQRCHDSAPRNSGENLIVFAPLSCASLEEAMFFDGAADGVSFRDYVEQVLAPTLRPR